MHAVTNTQSKKGNGLGMANVMYDKIFFFDFFFLFIYMLFFFLSCSLDKLSYYFTLQNLDRI